MPSRGREPSRGLRRGRGHDRGHDHGAASPGRAASAARARRAASADREEHRPAGDIMAPDITHAIGGVQVPRHDRLLEPLDVDNRFRYCAAATSKPLRQRVFETLPEAVIVDLGTGVGLGRIPELFPLQTGTIQLGTL